jgi:hypothetical protein
METKNNTMLENEMNITISSGLILRKIAMSNKILMKVQHVKELTVNTIGTGALHESKF